MENRKFPRKKVNLRVVCRPKGSSETAITARAVDVSRGGIGLKLDKSFNVSGKISVTIYKPLWQGHISGSGKVAWQSTLPSGECRMGIEFTSIGWTEWANFLG